MDFDPETFYAYTGSLEDDAPRPETMLSRSQFDALAEFARKFPGFGMGLVDMGEGYVLARLYDENGVVAGAKMLNPPP